MSEDNERIPFEPMMCLNQFADTMGFVNAAQGKPWIDDACSEAERRCAELFEGFYKSGDRTRYMAVLGYLAMDIAANVSHTLDRARIEEMGQ